MVWVNSEQNSGLVNFIPESRLTFVQFDSLSEKRPRRLETGVKDSFEKKKKEVPFGTFRPEKQNYLFRCSVAPGTERPQKSLPTGFSGNFL